MGGLRTFRPAIAALALLVQPAAGGGVPTDLSLVFADCAGRYSALTEHLWAIDGPASEHTALRRDAFVDLAEAALPRPDPASARRAMAWRIEAKAAQRQLLDRAAYGPPGPAAEAARDRAAALIAGCDRLLAGH